MKKVQKDKPVAILCVATSFGEVDWILPVITKLKQLHMEWEIVTVFGSQAVFQQVTQQSTLSEFFGDVSDINILYTEIHELFETVLDPAQVKIILKDYNKDEWAGYKKLLAAYCPSALNVSFPHSTHIYTNLDTDQLSKADNPDSWSFHDIFLLSSRHDIPHWSSLVSTEKIRITGYPRYDKWWQDIVLNTTAFSTSNEKRVAERSNPVFFYISRGEHPNFLNKSDYRSIVGGICEVVFSYKNSLLLIKPHPRQNINELKQMMGNCDPERCMISSLHLIQLASLSDVVISSWSSGILDSLSVNKPVIEFWKFNNENNWRTSIDGQKTTIYRELGLAHPANDSRELGDLIKKIIDDPADLKKKQVETFRKYCQSDTNASENAVALLLNELDQKNKKIKALVNSQTESRMLTEQIQYGEELLNQGFPEKALEYFTIMHSWYPADQRISNNLGVIYYHLGNFSKAESFLSEILKSDSNHVNAAINLLDLYLSQQQFEKGINTIRTFLKAASDEQKGEFLNYVRTTGFPTPYLNQVNLLIG